MPTFNTIKDAYTDNTDMLIHAFKNQSAEERYETLFNVLTQMKKRPGYVLNIGSGDGIDTTYFMHKGCTRITSTEADADLFGLMHNRIQKTELLESMGTNYWTQKQFYQSIHIHHDSLPELNKTKRDFDKYDIINLNTVFQPLNEDTIQTAAETMKSLLKPDGIIHVIGQQNLEVLQNSFSEMTLLASDDKKSVPVFIFAKPV